MVFNQGIKAAFSALRVPPCNIRRACITVFIDAGVIFVLLGDIEEFVQVPEVQDKALVANEVGEEVAFTEGHMEIGEALQ